MKSLVFLEHHGGALEKGGLGVLSKAASLGEAAGVVLGEGAAGVAGEGAGAFGASKVYVCEAAELAAPLPQPRVDALATLVEQTGADVVLFAASVLAADVASGLAARLDAGLNWDLADLVGHRRRARRQAAGARRHGARRRRLEGRPATGHGSLRCARSGRVGRNGGGRVVRDDVLRLLDARDARRADAGGVERPVDRGRGHHRRGWSGARLSRGLHDARGARRRARRRRRRDARGRRRRLVPVLDAGRADGQVRLAEAVHRLWDLGRDPAQGRDAGLGDDRRDQQGSERADLRLLRHRRRRRPASDRPEADGARALAASDSWPGRSTSLLRSAPAMRWVLRPTRATSGSRSASRSSARGLEAWRARSVSASCSRSTPTCASGSATFRSPCSRRGSRPARTYSPVR